MSDAVVHRYQPRALLCRTLAWLWILPSLGAGVILTMGFRNWSPVDGLKAGLRAVKFEQWCAVAVLLGHVIFILLAWRLRKTEPLREVAQD